jgi:hypothetical protein
MLRAALVALAVLSLTGDPISAEGPDHPEFFSSTAPMALTLDAPLKKLFEEGSEDEKYSVAGTLSYKDPDSGADVVLRDVKVSVRGHTSRRETECTFPKLKLKLPDGFELRIGTHCGETADATLTTKYGRLANDTSPLREALAYRLLEAAGVPVLRSRAARITYRDEGAGQPVVRNALLLEDDGDAMKRVKGTSEIAMESFGNVRRRRASADAMRIAFGEAMIGNFDWCLKFAPDDIYRCNEPRPLWNVLAFDRGDAATVLVMKDLDLAGVVVGKHAWFDTVFNPAFVPSKSAVDVEVLSQVQRTRSLFPRADLDTTRRTFLERKAAVYEALDKSGVDADGRAIARAYLDGFYKAIADDAEFYRSVVFKADVQVYTDAARTHEACGVKDVLRAGTPVNELQKSGTMSQVVILDAMWRWADKDSCKAVRTGPVWIQSDAITRDYPAKN